MSASAKEEDHRMPRRKKHCPEEIAAKLRQVEVLTGPGRRWPMRSGRSG
jgi:hypothetical protein